MESQTYSFVNNLVDLSLEFKTYVLFSLFGVKIKDFCFNCSKIGTFAALIIATFTIVITLNDDQTQAISELIRRYCNNILLRPYLRVGVVVAVSLGLLCENAAQNGLMAALAVNSLFPFLLSLFVFITYRNEMRLIGR